MQMCDKISYLGLWKSTDKSIDHCGYGYLRTSQLHPLSYNYISIYYIPKIMSKFCVLCFVVSP